MPADKIISKHGCYESIQKEESKKYVRWEYINNTNITVKGDEDIRQNIEVGNKWEEPE